jgi:hypothetical protein
MIAMYERDPIWYARILQTLSDRRILLLKYQSSAYDLISSIAVMQWSVDQNKSCCSSGLTQNL